MSTTAPSPITTATARVRTRDSSRPRSTIRCRLLVVLAVLGGLSSLKPPVDLVRLRVPPFAHPVLESGQERGRDRVWRRRRDGPHHDFRVGGDERGLRRYRSREDLHRVSIGARHTPQASTGLCVIRDTIHL